MREPAFQDLIPHNHCFGCGAHNERGLRIKSYWSGEGEATCTYRPEAHQAAGPRRWLNGGIIATILDCHAICTAVADAYRREGRAIGSDPEIWYVTGTLTVKYLQATPIDAPVELTARVESAGEKKTVLHCTLSSRGERRAEATLVAIRVPEEWRSGVA